MLNDDARLAQRQVEHVAGFPRMLHAVEQRVAAAFNDEPELAPVFSVSGEISTAKLQLKGLESNHPVIYNLSYDGDQLQFTIGGYMASGVHVLMSTDLASWQTAQSFSASTNLPVFSTSAGQPLCSFFKVQ